MKKMLIITVSTLLIHNASYSMQRGLAPYIAPDEIQGCFWKKCPDRHPQAIKIIAHHQQKSRNTSSKHTPRETNLLPVY